MASVSGNALKMFFCASQQLRLDRLIRWFLEGSNPRGISARIFAIESNGDSRKLVGFQRHLFCRSFPRWLYLWINQPFADSKPLVMGDPRKYFSRWVISKFKKGKMICPKKIQILTWNCSFNGYILIRVPVCSIGAVLFNNRYTSANRSQNRPSLKRICCIRNVSGEIVFTRLAGRFFACMQMVLGRTCERVFWSVRFFIYGCFQACWISQREVAKSAGQPR